MGAKLGAPYGIIFQSFPWHVAGLNRLSNKTDGFIQLIFSLQPGFTN